MADHARMGGDNAAMQVPSAQIAPHLQRGLKSLYTLYGDEPLQQQECADALRRAARAAGYTDRSVFTVAGAHFDWSEVLAAGGSLSLFADKQIVEVRIPSGKPGRGRDRGHSRGVTVLSLPPAPARIESSRHDVDLFIVVLSDIP